MKYSIWRKCGLSLSVLAAKSEVAPLVAEIVAKAEPDGHTLLLMSSGGAVNAKACIPLQ
jgi:hypothetical protein